MKLISQKVQQERLKFTITAENDEGTWWTTIQGKNLQEIAKRHFPEPAFRVSFICTNTNHASGLYIFEVICPMGKGNATEKWLRTKAKKMDMNLET